MKGGRSVMKVLLVNEENLITIQQNCEPTVMALGFFDGVHKGHQKVIFEAKEKAKRSGLQLAVMSFFPHPKTVFSNEEMDYLMPMEQKAERLKMLGVDVFYIIDFTKVFASLSPVTFVQEYLVKLQVKHVVAGYDYTYGHKGAGTIDTIRPHSDGQIQVDKVEKYALYGEKVSSTAIRSLLKEGKVEAITLLIGKPYDVKYSVRDALLPYYTLPKAGTYYTTVLVENRAISQIVTVVNKNEIEFSQRISSDQCKVIFHERIYQHEQMIG